MPYVFQIMSQLLELHDPPAPATYQELFPHLLAPALWEKMGMFHRAHAFASVPAPLEYCSGLFFPCDFTAEMLKPGFWVSAS